MTNRHPESHPGPGDAPEAFSALRDRITEKLAQVWPIDPHLNADGNRRRLLGIVEIVMAEIGDHERQVRAKTLRETAEYARYVASQFGRGEINGDVATMLQFADLLTRGENR